VTAKEITFTKKLDNGKTVTRVASTPNEIVQLQFDGWTEKKTSASAGDGDGKRPATK
jgi:hypothetical protein